MGGSPILIDKVVAVVNDEVITWSELQREGKPLIQRVREELREDARATQTQITQRQILEALILRRLQLQEAKKEKVVVDAGEVTATLEQIKKQNRITSDADFAQALARENLTLEDFKTKVWEQLVVDRLLARKVRTGIVVSEEEMLQYYQNRAASFQQPSAVRIQHILIRFPEPPAPEDVARARGRGAEALEQLKGGTDFAAVAALYSDGAAVREGGDIGIVRKGELDPALEAAAFSLEPGGISGLVQTAAGFNIIKVEERKAGDVTVPMAQVRDQVRQRLFAEKLRQRTDAYHAELKEKAYIDIRLDQ
jgi:peptidyl-prolyl cis-trans isomerase SurA